VKTSKCAALAEEIGKTVTVIAKKAKCAALAREIGKTVTFIAKTSKCAALAQEIGILHQLHAACRGW